MRSTASESKATLLPENLALFILCAIFFITGAAGLIYQVVWHRKLVDIIGISLYSVCAIVTAFMSGLGLGGFAGGRLSRRLKNPMLGFALAEILTGIFGAASFPALNGASRWFQFLLLDRLPERFTVVAYFAGSFAFLLPPTFLMGLSLPLLTETAVRQKRNVQERLGWLYGSNTLGAAVGALVSGFVLIEAFGLSKTAMIAAGLNLAAGAAALATSRYWRADSAAAETASQPERPVRNEPSSGRRYAFWIGFLSLGYEIFIFRYLTVLLGDIPYTFPIILYFYLGFIGIGSFLSTRILRAAGRSRADLANDIFRYLAGIIFLISVIFLSARLAGWNVFNLNRALGLSSGTYLDQLTDPFFPRRLLFAICFVLLSPGLLFGALFPVYVAMDDPREVGESVGAVYLFNSMGSVLGSLAFSLWVIPHWGSNAALIILTTVPVFLLLSTEGLSSGNARLRWPIAGLGIAVAIFLLGRGNIIPTTAPLERGASIVDAVEGRLGVFSLEKRGRDRSGYGLFVNNMSAGSLELDLNRGYFGYSVSGLADDFVNTVLIDGKGTGDAFFLGFGDGGRQFVASLYPGFRKIYVSELSPEVYDLNFKINPEGRGRFLANPRIALSTGDARKYLELHDQSFSLINLISYFHIQSGSGYVYSEEFLRTIKDRLDDDGIAMIMTTPGDGPFFRAVLKVFDHVVLFGPRVLCSKRPIHLTKAGFRSRWEAMPSDFRSRVPWKTVESFLDKIRPTDAHTASAELLSGAAASTIDRPLSEYTLLSVLRSQSDGSEDRLAEFYRELRPIPW